MNTNNIASGNRVEDNSGVTSIAAKPVSLYKAINKADVVHVYSGKAHKCMCGCAGKHSYAMRAVEAQSKSHGYRVTGSDRAVTRIVNLINNAPAHAEMEYDADYVAATVDGRVYVAWFK